MNRISRGLLNLRVGPTPPAHWPPERLGLLERWYAAQPEPRVAGCVLEFDSRQDQVALAGALERLRERHPWALDVTLRRGRRGRWSFERRPGASLPFSVADSAVWTCAERELEASFPQDGLLWRARLAADRRALVVLFHHVIADGVSTSIFARELLALLAGQGPSGAGEARLPLDARLDLRPSLAHFAREAAADLWTSAPSYFRGPSGALGPRRTRLHPFELAPELVRSLAERARAEGTTVHAALCAAGLLAIANTAGSPLTARVLSPISLRSRAVPPPSGLGVFLCAHEADVRVGKEDAFWRVAAGYGRRLAGALPEAFERLGMLRFAGDLGERASRLTREHPNARTGTLEVSNLGRLEGLAAARVSFVQGNHYHGPLFNVTVGTCAETGVLRAVLCVAEPVVEDDVAASFVQGTRAALERAAV